MSTNPIRKLLSVFVGSLLGATSVAAATPQPWAFVVSVGGITVGDPVRVDGGWSLPVQADVSGLETFTSKPTVLNSALVCSIVATRTGADAIYLTIFSDLPGAAKSARCTVAILGAVAPGNYTVFYKGPQDAPVRLRTIHVGL
jgi:hypothetical protein